MTHAVDADRVRSDDDIDRVRPDDLLELAVDRGQVPWQVGVLLVLDRPLDPSAVREALAERVRSVPRLRRRLVSTPPLCGRPVWVDDPGFTVERHVREVRCPGDDAALHDVAVRAVGTRLSLRHPPWSAVVVTGLAGDRGALVVVIHHVLADGIGGLAVLAQLVDGAPPRDDDRFPRRPPSRRRLFADATAARMRAIARPTRGLRQVRDAVRELRSTRTGRAPRTSLARPTGPRRALRVVRTDLAAVRAAAHAHGGTINDVVLTAVGGALGALLLRRGETPGQVVVSVPISSRTGTGADDLSNAVGVLPVAVPTCGPPAERLVAVARRTAAGRAAPRAASALLLDAGFRLVAATGALPWILDHQRLVTTFVTNLRGPRSPLALLGVRIREIVPVTTTTGNVPVVFGALSYAGTLVLTVVADADVCPEIDALAADIHAELQALGATSGSTSGSTVPATTSRSPLPTPPPPSDPRRMTQTHFRTDAELKQAIVDELVWTPEVDATHIGVSVTDGAVTLSGEVTTYPERYHAEQAVRRVRGVTAVAEQITVRSTWVSSNDTDLARQAGEAIERAVDVPPDAVVATVHDHRITLTGTVTWQFQRRAAERAVKYLKGVTAVHNAIMIRPTAISQDIRTSIRSAFVRSAHIDGSHVDVRTGPDGAITLVGQVRSDAERRQAEEVAWAAPGVSSVDNLIRVMA